MFKHFMFDGIEGCGKDTKIKDAGQFLESKGIIYVSTREPGGTLFGEDLRQVLLNPATEKDQVALLTAFFANRIEVAEGIVKPALRQGKVVLQNRGLASTFAYQVATQEDSRKREELREIYFHLLDFYLQRELIVLPDFIFWLDLPVEQGLERAKIISAGEDYFENKKIGFHKLVQQGFGEIIPHLAHRYAVTYLKMNTANDIKPEVSQQFINGLIAMKLGLTL